MTKCRVFLLETFLLLFFIVPTAGVAAQDADIDLEEVERSIVERTNEFRREKGLEPLKSEESLEEAAEAFAKFMAENDKYGHQADGRTAAERAEAAGYNYCVVRENIAYRKDPTELTADELAEFFTQGWIDSPSHRENMLAEFISETGVGVATTDGTTFYAVQMFGRPESAAYRVTITNRSDTTVTLKIVSEGAADEIEMGPRMRLRAKRCFPITLKLVDADATEKVSDAVTFDIVTASGGGLTFKPQSEDASEAQTKGTGAGGNDERDSADAQP